MGKYIFDQCNGLWYELQGNYYIPCFEYAGHNGARRPRKWCSQTA